MMSAQQQQVIAIVSLALIAWAGYLMYDMNQLKKRPEFQERFAHLTEQEPPASKTKER
jgi:FtsH-binding integral membrane protein